MIIVRILLFLGIILGPFHLLTAQEVVEDTGIELLDFQTYIAYVKQHHPVVKQANLLLTEGEAKVLKARGAFDPKIEFDYDAKDFKDSEYWNILNATFKIPTYYGIEFKANFEENTGEFLNPQFSVPENGLYSAGVSLNLADGLLINDRMANLQKAKFFRQQNEAERELLINQILADATVAYLQWSQAYQEEQLYQNFLQNASIRLDAVTASVEAGDMAQIDITEARIALSTRRLSLEAAKLKRIKAGLDVSNYLWINDIPLEVQNNIRPQFPEETQLLASLNMETLLTDTFDTQNHPKIQSLEAKIQSLKVDKRLKLNNLLPDIRLDYNFLTTAPRELETFNTDNFKAGLTINFPLFLRKERGDLKLAKAKLQNTQFDQLSMQLGLQNKVEMTLEEIASLGIQNDVVLAMVSDYQDLLSAEERKFELGDSSLFLINSREQKLIDSQLKSIEIQTKSRTSLVTLFNVRGNSLSQ